jgi:hypothetical protein
MLRMTDIVERLRDWPNCTPVTCKEAADEIERLRAETVHQRNVIAAEGYMTPEEIAASKVRIGASDD